MTKQLLGLCASLLALQASAQAPAGYYTDTAGLGGYNLKTRLHQIIKQGHVDNGYGGLWTGYKDTDRDFFYENDGTLLDVYSENPTGNDSYNYNVISSNDQCGNYNSEADCYNREHTVPQSLFNEASPMKNDIQFVLPTDGYVNGKRGNLPYGMVNNPTWTSDNGSKLGTNVFGSYTGQAFEPIDEFKGDIARVVFYFATRYQDRIPNFSLGNILDGTSTRSLQQWQVDLLLSWHQQDPVSAREIDRNNKAFIYQGNRNPFIDNPNWVDCIWANQHCSTTAIDTGSTSTKQVDLLAKEISLYPNPSTDNIQINLANENNSLIGVQILSIDGRLLMQQDQTDRQDYTSINIAHLEPGVYFVRILTKSGLVVKKLMKY